MKITKPLRLIYALAIGVSLSITHVKAETKLALRDAISQAIANDPWLYGSKLKQSALENTSVAAGTLPDPKVSIGLLNMPVDSWDIGQEGMTQFKLGVSQMFPRGDSLAIKSAQLKTESTQFPLLREDRKAKLTSIVSGLWLDVYLAQSTLELIKKDWTLFEQMADVAKVSYANAVGKTKQQDVIRAQLEITQLEDRYSVEQQKLESARARLSQWLHRFDADNLASAFDYDMQPSQLLVENHLPEIQLFNPQLLQDSPLSRNKLARILAKHPAILAIGVKQKAAEQGEALAKQQYKPQWGVNASYGLRDSAPNGSSRADLFSVGITFDVPLFTDNRQDKQVAASVAQTESIKTDKLLLTKTMLSSLEKELLHVKRLSERQARYQQQILTQTQDQAEAALIAYTNDDGDFAEVVRARVAQLNANIAALKIDVDVQKALARINYFFAKSDASYHIAHTAKQRTE
ncbi:transporter [Saccharobesus litoralis]|uniref:Transporter n=1 Tax=Saccharobesus litoralis TaxID=2172099 RepID=A0A2S0VUK9_9ALTE|nr:TolC family protein [Saccharobesus litoralis]AWB67873.1 transporter [Saccharobesus litoralis]